MKYTLLVSALICSGFVTADSVVIKAKQSGEKTAYGTYSPDLYATEKPVKVTEEPQLNSAPVVPMPAITVSGAVLESSDNVLVQRYLQPGESDASVPTATPTHPLVSQQYSIKKGGTYRSGIAKWLWQDGVDLIAWDQSLNDYLDSSVATAFDINANSAQQAIALLASKNKPVLKFGKTTLATGQVVAAIHTFNKPHVHYTSGSTLQQVVSALAQDYGWNFDIKTQWLIKDDFKFATSYPVVTELGDIETALLQVLDGFPVRAQVLHSTKQIFIVEDRENDE